MKLGSLHGIKDLIPFLNYLDQNKVSYWLSHDRDDSIMVEITLLGKRIEVDFMEDHIEYSIFYGNEDVLDDVPSLFAMIENFVRE
jgi:hypothetical protein